MAKDIKHPAEKSLGWLLLQAARAHRNRVGDKLSGLGLFAGQEQVLQTLDSSGPLSMGELAGVLRVRPPTVSKAVARLSTLGLVRRRSQKEDGRVIRVELTTEGREKATQIEALWDEVEQDLLVDLDSKDQRRLRKMLRRIARNLTRQESPAAALEELASEIDTVSEPAA